MKRLLVFCSIILLTFCTIYAQTDSSKRKAKQQTIQKQQAIGTKSHSNNRNSNTGNSSKTSTKISSSKEKKSSPSGMVGNHMAVDLGLSIRWADCNVGANIPNDNGTKFAFGDPSHSITSKDVHDYPTGTILGTDKDMAKHSWGYTWRLPSREEFYELKDNCTWLYTTVDGAKGYKITGKNGNSIFMPTTDKSSIEVNNYGYYWGGWSNDYYGITLTLYCSYVSVSQDKYKYYGQYVRPVTE